VARPVIPLASRPASQRIYLLDASGPANTRISCEARPHWNARLVSFIRLFDGARLLLRLTHLGKPGRILLLDDGA
jgi:hypothetical protein